MEPIESAGLFMGWVIEPGCRHRQQLIIADLDNFKNGKFSRRLLKQCPESQVHFRDKVVFPFAALTDHCNVTPSAMTWKLHPNKWKNQRTQLLLLILLSYLTYLVISTSPRRAFRNGDQGMDALLVPNRAHRPSTLPRAKPASTRSS